MGNLLIGQNENETAFDVLKRLCKKSYDSEKILYNKIDKSLLSFPTGEEDYYDFSKKMFADPIFFGDFQKAMKKLVYGDKEYIKYFYDSRVVNQIAAESSEQSRDLISDALYEIMGSGYIKGQQVKFDSTNMDSQINNLIEDIANKIIKNQDKLFDAEIEKYKGILFESIKKHLYNAKFSFGYSSDTPLQKEWTINEQEFISDITPNNKADSKALKSAKVREPYSKNGEIITKMVTVVAKLGDLKNLAASGARIQIFGNKDILLPVLTQVIDDFADQTGIKVKRDDGNTLRSENLFKIESDKDDLYIDLSTYKKFKIDNPDNDWGKTQKDIKTVIDIFFRVLKSVIIPIMKKDELDEKTIKDFEADCGADSKVRKDMEKLLLKNPSSLYEILSKRTRAHVSGMLGETLFSIFLETFNEDNQSNVEIFGQTDLGTGQAAVDIGLITKELHKIGFQIKNYGSIVNTISLYSQSNKLSAEKEMKRYIEEKYYRILHRIFLENTEDSLLWTNNDNKTKDLLTEAENILNKHIPYYARFDEAQIENSSIQNNFYIINFSFVPASTILYIMAEAVKEMVENQKTKTMFFLSSIKQEDTGVLDAQTDFKGSWDSTYKEISAKIPNKTENLLSSLNENLYVNFVGMRITFQNKLEILFYNVSKIKKR